MDETPEQSRQTEQAAPASSQTMNPGAEQAPLSWQAAVYQGFSTFGGIGMATFNAVCQWYRAWTAMTWTTRLTMGVCFAASALAYYWLCRIMWRIAMCDISELGAWSGSVAGFFTPPWCLAQSQPPVSSATSATPTPVLPLSTGVTAVAGLLATEVAALASASASVPGVASVVNQVFPGFGHDGLNGQQVVQADWTDIALEASTQSGAIIDEFYAELRNEDNLLTHIGRVAQAVADRGSGKAHGPNFLSVLWGSGLKQHRKTCQRNLDSLSMLAETAQQAHDTFRANLSAFLETQLTHLNILVKLAHDSDEDGEAAQATGPGDFFQFAIDRLNQEVFDSKSGTFWKPAPACSDPDQASFVRGLHTAGGAGAMVDGAFIRAIDRLNGLSGAMDMERTWIEHDFKRWLGPLLFPESGCSTTAAEFYVVVEEVVFWAEEWRRKHQELYYD